MGKKKKNVIRCNVCGVKATKHIAGELHVCDNIVCETETKLYIAEEVRKQKEGGRQ